MTKKLKTRSTLLLTSSFLATFLGTAFSSMSIANVNYADNSGFSITNESESYAQVEVVYSHFIQHVDMWWPKDHTWWKGALRIDEQAGGCFCETTDTASAAHMQVSYVEPNKKVDDRWLRPASRDGYVRCTDMGIQHNSIEHFIGCKHTRRSHTEN